MTPAPVPINIDPPNAQTAELFAAESATIDAAAVPLTWIRPSDHDPDRISATEAIALELGDVPEVSTCRSVQAACAGSPAFVPW